MNLKTLEKFDKSLTPIQYERLKQIKAGYDYLELERRKKILSNNN